MADEEFERYKNFILEQQAQSVVKIAQIEAAQARFAEDLSRLTDNVGQLAANTRLLAEGTLARFNDVDERISALVDAQIKTEENVNKTDENVKQLEEQIRETSENVKQTSENVKKTEEALRKFIARLDRYTEGRNGGTEQ